MAKYQVYGNSISSQNGDCVASSHRTLSAAARMADKLNERDCVDGGNLLWHIQERIHKGPMTEDDYGWGYHQEGGDTWRTVDFFDTHEVAYAPGGFVPVSKF